MDDVMVCIFREMDETEMGEREKKKEKKKNQMERMVLGSVRLVALLLQV